MLQHEEGEPSDLVPIHKTTSLLAGARLCTYILPIPAFGGSLLHWAALFSFYNTIEQQESYYLCILIPLALITILHMQRMSYFSYFYFSFCFVSFSFTFK